MLAGRRARRVLGAWQLWSGALIVIALALPGLGQGDFRTDSHVYTAVTAQMLETGEWDETAMFAVRLAMEEGLSNAMNHGNGADPGRCIEVEFTGDASRCSAVIVDEGPGYDPDSVPDPTAEENLTVASGRGLTLIRAFMTEVTVVAPGNRLEMTYVRPGE